jgi:hypothetical protein
MINLSIAIPHHHIYTFCEHKPIKQLALFGSILRDDFTEKSDVDILIEFLPNAGVTYFDMAAYQAELTEIIGRQVDLRTANELSRYFVDGVLQSAVIIYDRQ